MPFVSKNLCALINIVILVNILPKQVSFRKLLLHFEMSFVLQFHDLLVKLVVSILEAIKFLNDLFDIFNAFLHCLKFTQLATCEIVNESLRTYFVLEDEMAFNWIFLLFWGLALAVKNFHTEWEKSLRDDSRTYSWKVCHELHMLHSALEVKILTIILITAFVKLYLAYTIES